jgi:hypothetical protein
MDFATIIAAVAVGVRAEYADASKTVSNDVATSSRDGYEVSIADRHDGFLLVSFAIDGSGDDLLERAIADLPRAVSCR